MDLIHKARWALSLLTDHTDRTSYNVEGSPPQADADKPVKPSSKQGKPRGHYKKRITQISHACQRRAGFIGVKALIFGVSVGYKLRSGKQFLIGEKGLVLGTWALAVVSFLALRDSKEALTEAQRAWLAPTGVYLTPIASAGDDIKVSLTYLNAGKEPAIDFMAKLTAKVYQLADFNTRASKGFAAIRAQRDECFALKPTVGTQVIYPSVAPNSYTMFFDGNPSWLKGGEKVLATQGLITGDDILIIVGCMAYRSEDKPHHSTVCYYYSKASKDLPMSLPFCQIGSDAD